MQKGILPNEYYNYVFEQLIFHGKSFCVRGTKSPIVCVRYQRSEKFAQLKFSSLTMVATEETIGLRISEAKRSR